MNTPESGRRRRRLRGMLENKHVQRGGWTLLATSVVSALAYDLKQPDSIVRGLLRSGYQKLVTYTGSKIGMLDISDRVKVTDISNNEPKSNAELIEEKEA